MRKLKYYLIQCRVPGDPSLRNELESFADALDTDVESITSMNLVEQVPAERDLNSADVFLVGGAGNYGVLGDEPWLSGFCRWLEIVCRKNLPLFCSCYGFQALTVALGGKVVHDPMNIEIGSIDVTLTEDGKQDELFGKLPERFPVQIGHKDRAERLPHGVVHLVSGVTTDFEAFRIPDTPVYATQFHPELTVDKLKYRFLHYSDDYSGKLVGRSKENVLKSLKPSPDANKILRMYVSFLREQGIV